jgi:hypothetical protein
VTRAKPKARPIRPGVMPSKNKGSGVTVRQNYTSGSNKPNSTSFKGPGVTHNFRR